MTATQTAGSPALYSGPFNTLHSLGIDRGNYIAVHSNDPAAAALYAVENMGFYLVHADSEGRHYLAAHGLDAYSLVYTPGEKDLLPFVNAESGRRRPLPPSVAPRWPLSRTLRPGSAGAARGSLDSVCGRRSAAGQVGTKGWPRSRTKG